MEVIIRYRPQFSLINMKNILILSFLLILGNCSIFCQNNDFSKEQTVDSTENNQNNTSVKKSTEDELKKGLSGKYEGILEVSLGSEMYDHKKVQFILI